MNKTNYYKKIVIDEIPLVDLRAPIEFSKGAFKNAVNLPLINDEERRLIGICYKEKGAEKALELGYKLVSGKIKEERINAWVNHFKKFPNCILYCFRGGSRSIIAQTWLKEKGIYIPYIEGGYKAFRNYLLSYLEKVNIKSKPILLGGYTGSRKTELLSNFTNFINLEKLANHRGSSFGKYITTQPTQINFENNLSYNLIQHESKKYQYLLLEDEGRNIGKNYIPKALANFFNKGNLIIIDVPLENRILNTLDEYVIKSQKEYLNYYKDEGLEKWAEYIKSSLFKIKKRLGDERYRRILNNFNQAYNKQLSINDYSPHISWISNLLTEYYDPMYKYQIKNTNKKIIFQGNYNEVFEFIKYNYAK